MEIDEHVNVVELKNGYYLRAHLLEGIIELLCQFRLTALPWISGYVTQISSSVFEPVSQGFCFCFWYLWQKKKSNSNLQNY